MLINSVLILFLQYLYKCVFIMLNSEYFVLLDDNYNYVVTSL